MLITEKYKRETANACNGFLINEPGLKKIPLPNDIASTAAIRAADFHGAVTAPIINITCREMAG